MDEITQRSVMGVLQQQFSMRNINNLRGEQQHEKVGF